jgi:molybdate transport system substrate-binding protein
MEIHVFSGNGMRAALAELTPRFERESGNTLRVSYDPAQIILRRVDNGETADVALLGEEAIDRLVAAGIVAASSRRLLARNGIGLGVRAGAPKPDIATREAFVQALRAADSIAYTSEGASGIYFADLIERLGIGDTVRAKARTQPGGLVGELVVAGQAQMAIQQLPELLAVPGIEVVGPLPDEVQKINTTAAGVFTRSQAGAAASSLIEFLASAPAREVFRAKGFEPATQAGA